MVPKPSAAKSVKQMLAFLPRHVPLHSPDLLGFLPPIAMFLKLLQIKERLLAFFYYLVK